MEADTTRGIIDQEEGEGTGQHFAAHLHRQGMPGPSTELLGHDRLHFIAFLCSEEIFRKILV